MNNTSIEKIKETFHQPLAHIIRSAQAVGADTAIQAASLLSIKTGGCPEDCAYCPQAARYQTGVAKTPLMGEAQVLKAARQAIARGATRLCLGAAWRSVKDGPEFDQVVEMVAAVHRTGLEVCCTLGMLSPSQAARLKRAGLHAYNHNIDTSREHYGKVIQSRDYDDRLETIANVRAAGLTVCTGGILGLGETEEDRIAFIHQILSFDTIPESITINTLVPFTGTPLEGSAPVPILDVVRVIGTLRIFAPQSAIRLSAGRAQMSDEAQFLCFLAGANSIFLGDKLLTSPNPAEERDLDLLHRLGYRLKERGATHAGE